MNQSENLENMDVREAAMVCEDSNNSQDDPDSLAGSKDEGYSSGCEDLDSLSEFCKQED